MSCTRATASTPAPCCASSSAPATLVRGELRPGGSDREWCDVEVLRRLRRASLAALRKEIEPADQRRLAAFLPSWQGVDRHSGAGAGVDRLREVLVPLQGLALPVEIWERDVLPRRTGAYSQSWMDSLCASGEVVWVGAGPLGRSGRVALYFREDAPAIGPPAAGPSARAGGAPPSAAEPEHELAARAPGRRARPSSPTCSPSSTPPPRRCARRCGTSSGRARSPTTPGRPCARRAWRSPAPRARPAARARAAGGTARRPSERSVARASAAGGAPARRRDQVQGRWSLTETVFRGGPEGASGAAERRRTLAELLLERYGIVTREQVLAEGIRGGFAMLYDTFCNLETLGICRRGYFVEGMGGAQFALPGAVERLRAAPGLAAGRAGGPGGEGERDRTLVIAAADPAQPYGAALPWPKREGIQSRPPAPRAWPAPTWCWSRTSPCCTSSAAGAAWSRSPTRPADASPTRCARRWRRSPRRSAPGGSESSRSSGSTASPRSPRASPGSSSSWDSTPVRAA